MRQVKDAGEREKQWRKRGKGKGKTGFFLESQTEGKVGEVMENAEMTKAKRQEINSLRHSI